MYTLPYNSIQSKLQMAKTVPRTVRVIASDPPSLCASYGGFEGSAKAEAKQSREKMPALVAPGLLRPPAFAGAEGCAPRNDDEKARATRVGTRLLCPPYVSANGSMTVTSRSRKCRTLRVASSAFLERTMPAISVSRISIGRP